ncbi:MULTISPECIES: helix-turn-helix transcriptional regulator [unclassified Streptomyces]|uniref:helix-turn-helix domain-containing protein n=1 Tax=unclassified Streptomyces TaxID=2593676 RepID=UPI000B80F07F|nr:MULTISPECIES: helix-turn-helix transcriptional regulator [unclassified Streptomyces]MYZ40790.1 helix-turn-helix domain-containing protein [Streptomyces sp. SID4917]
MAQSDMPTMRSRRLGNELKRLRVERGFKVQDIADKLQCGQPKVSQIENGKRGIRPLDLTVLLEFYGIDDEAYIASIRRLAKEIHKVDWWSSQGPLLHDTLRDYLTLEADSELIREYDPSVIPGLLQTEAYMSQIFATRHPADKVVQLVKTRMKRKELLDSHLDFRLRTIIDAPVLHRISGSSAVAREQLEHLLAMDGRPNINIQILPLDASIPAEQYAPFTLFSLRGEPSIDVTWLEHVTGGTLLEQRTDVQAYARVWDEFTAAALSPSASRQYIRDRIKDSGS